MSGLIVGTGAKLAETALFKSAAGIFSAIPKPVWEALAVLGYVLALIGLHQHYAHTAITQAKLDQRAADQTVLDKTVANYRAAAEQARKDDATNKARVEAEQTKINQESSNDYEARIAAARAVAQRLRDELAQAAAHPGSAGKPPVSSVPIAARGPAQTTGQDRFSITDRLTATEQAIQLDELIKWNRKQAAVNVNGK